MMGTWDFIHDVVNEYLRSPLSYSLGAMVFGLVTHRFLSWLFSPNGDRSGSQTWNEEGSLLSDMVIPSRCLKWKLINFRGRWHTSVESINGAPTSPDWKPLLVFVNRKSGSNQGSHILDECRKLLNPVQVHDLDSRAPTYTLELCQLLPETTFIILVCGGDGTVNWILNAIDALGLKTTPHVAVLPLGTGNDLSNMLGWGTSFGDEDTVENILAQLRCSHPLPIDRWIITVDYGRTYLGWGRRGKHISVTNYFSIGCDALIALNFHEQRQKQPSLFTRRSLNKLFYFGYGAIDVLEQHCKDLNKHIELWLDGEKVELPDLEGVMFLNVSYWGGGCRIWDNMSDGDLQRWNYSDPGDGRIEVMGVTSSLHMGQIQMNLAEPIRLGQVRRASILVKTKVPAQADGEPWEQEPCRIGIAFNKQATLLMKDAKESPETKFLQLETS